MTGTRAGRRLRVSIVTPSFNQARFIRATIESVLSQQGSFELEYLIVDGGSTDGTLEILRGYGERLTWMSEPDQGQVDAINKGWARCTGDIVGWLNSDDLLLPGSLDRVARVFLAKQETEWVHGRCRIINEDGRRIRRWVEAYKHFRAKRHSLKNLLVENYVSQMTVFCRRSLLETVGYLDPRYQLAFDYELWLRFARRGDPVYIEEPQACFRWYPQSKSGAGFVEQFEQDLAVAIRHGAGQAGVLSRKKAMTAVFVTTYRLMGLVRTAVTLPQDR